MLRVRLTCIDELAIQLPVRVGRVDAARRSRPRPCIDSSTALMVKVCAARVLSQDDLCSRHEKSRQNGELELHFDRVTEKVKGEVDWCADSAIRLPSATSIYSLRGTV